MLDLYREQNFLVNSRLTKIRVPQLPFQKIYDVYDDERFRK